MNLIEAEGFSDPRSEQRVADPLLQGIEGLAQPRCIADRRALEVAEPSHYQVFRHKERRRNGDRSRAP